MPLTRKCTHPFISLPFSFLSVLPMSGTTIMYVPHWRSFVSPPKWSMNPLVSGTKKRGLTSSSNCPPVCSTAWNTHVKFDVKFNSATTWYNLPYSIDTLHYLKTRAWPKRKQILSASPEIFLPFTQRRIWAFHHWITGVFLTNGMCDFCLMQLYIITWCQTYRHMPITINFPIWIFMVRYVHICLFYLYFIPALLLLCQFVGEGVASRFQLSDVILTVSRLLCILLSFWCREGGLCLDYDIISLQNRHRQG